MSRTIAVTGAASGIGLALTTMLRDRGDRVIDVDLKAAEVCADLGTAAGRAAAAEDISRLCDGVLDGLVTCAGTSVPSELMIRVNYFGTTQLVAALQPALAASPAGRVVVIGSISGTQAVHTGMVEACLADDEEAALGFAREVTEAGDPNRIYPSSKSALAQWARRTCISPGFADAGIALNVVAPGVVLTPMSAPLFDNPAMVEAMAQAVPMPLNGHMQPEVVAELLAFLVSAANSHVTGQVIYADGGAEVTLRPAAHF